MIQMVFAILKYQNYVRNSDGSDSYKQVRDQSFAHFHYALSHVYTLTSSRRTEDMQALAMFCIHLRYFPKPGPAWMITGWFLSMCIEMGMHRSAKCCTGQESKKDLISIEMQKRVFWTLLSLHVQASGKMGRPMLLRSEDFDVDFPQAIPDGLGAEAGKPPGQTCSIWPAIEVFKLTHLLLDTYNTIYTIKPAPDYDGTIHQLEQRAQQWRDQLPTLSNHENEDPNCDPNAPVFALWIKFWDAEMQLLMHHPALCRTQAPEVKAANLQKCLDAAWNIIDMSASARRKKVLDTTWQNTTTFVAAIFTLLFGFWNRRHQITKADFARLRRQMDVCLDILEELGRMLGKFFLDLDLSRMIIQLTIHKARVADFETRFVISSMQDLVTSIASWSKALPLLPWQTLVRSRRPILNITRQLHAILATMLRFTHSSSEAQMTPAPQCVDPAMVFKSRSLRLIPNYPNINKRSTLTRTMTHIRVQKVEKCLSLPTCIRATSPHRH